MRLPGGTTAGAVRELLGPSHCRLMEGGVLCILERPSWLIFSGHTCTLILVGWMTLVYCIFRGAAVMAFILTLHLSLLGMHGTG